MLKHYLCIFIFNLLIIILNVINKFVEHCTFVVKRIHVANTQHSFTIVNWNCMFSLIDDGGVGIVVVMFTYDSLYATDLNWKKRLV